MSWLNRRMQPLDTFCADRVRFVRSVQAEIGVLITPVEIERAGSQRIADATLQPARVFGVHRHPADHVCGRRPMRPFGLPANDGRAAKIERFLPSDADGVASRDAAGLDQIQAPLGDVHDDCPRPVGAGEGDLLAKQARVDPGEVEPGNLVPVVEDRTIGGRRFGISERIEPGPYGPPRGAAQPPSRPAIPRRTLRRSTVAVIVQTSHSASPYPHPSSAARPARAFAATQTSTPFNLMAGRRYGIANRHPPAPGGRKASAAGILATTLR